MLESQAPQNTDVSAPPLQTALLLCGNILSSEDYKLRELLDFLGINWKPVSIQQMAAGGAFSDGGEYGILSSAADMAQALQAVMKSHGELPHWLMQASSVYISGFEHTDHSQELLRFLTGDSEAVIRDLNKPPAVMLITADFPEFCGPMSGLEVQVDVSKSDRMFGITPRNDRFRSIITTGEGQVFVRVLCQGVPFYLDVSPNIVDLSSPSEKQFDVKKHFCSAVPVTLYLKWAFRDTCWSNSETSACLVVDDPPLKPRYGFLDFREISDLMEAQNFTTAIAFIPWNWRRTNRHTVDLLRSRPEQFCLAVHGCDHTACEFATRSTVLLDKKIRAARQKMDSLAQRSSLPYERIMVFPQGVFSPETGCALKLNGFVAAVNTEVAPWKNYGNETTLRDLWNVAIMKYGTFPIFTRRYLDAGIENFAFDAVLGKPCLIAAHHDVFKNSGRDLTAFIDRLNSLKWNLCWRPLGEALDHSFRVRIQADETIVIQMFSASLAVGNPSPKPWTVVFMKEEGDVGSVEAITFNHDAIDFTCDDGYVRFRIWLRPKETAHIRFSYCENQNTNTGWANGGVGYRLKTRLRRYLSEFRDNYISQVPFLEKNVTSIRHRLRG